MVGEESGGWEAYVHGDGREGRGAGGGDGGDDGEGKEGISWLGWFATLDRPYSSDSAIGHMAKHTVPQMAQKYDPWTPCQLKIPVI